MSGSPSIAARVDEFLFAPLDGDVVKWFRVLLGVASIYFFWPGPSDLGPMIRSHEWLTWLYQSIFPSKLYQAPVFICLLSFTVGYRPRLFGVIAVLMLLPLSQFAYAFASRQPILVALACFLFIDSRRRSDDPGPIWPIRLIQLQLSLIYLINAAIKMHPAYLSGDVIAGLAEMVPNFRLQLVNGSLAFGPIAVPPWLAAWGTVATEAFLGVAFWFRRTRWVAAVVGVGFHVSLMFVISIYNLDWATMFLYLAFLLPWQRRTPLNENYTVVGSLRNTGSIKST